MSNSEKNTMTTIGKDLHAEITKRCAALTIETGQRVKMKDWVEKHLAIALQSEDVDLPGPLLDRLDL